MAQQGTGPITDVSVLHGDFWPEEESIEEFVATYREWRGHKRAKPVTMGIVGPLGAIMEDLKLLPPEKLKVAADFIRRLKETSEEERLRGLDQNEGTLPDQDRRRAVQEMLEFAGKHGLTLGDDLRIRDLIREGRKY